MLTGDAMLLLTGGAMLLPVRAHAHAHASLGPSEEKVRANP